MYRQNMIGNLRYVFKDALKYIPLYGYVFGVHGGVFVTRDGSYNENSMKKVLNKLQCRWDIIGLICVAQVNKGTCPLC